jgi:hypothetical protein
MRNNAKVANLIIFSLLVLVSAVADLSAQPEGDILVLGETARLYSDILKEERQLLVYMPIGYETGQGNFPVMFLLDGSTHFHHVSGICNFLTRQNLMPPTLIVALINTDRTRDFTPSKDESREYSELPTAGRADTFLAFFEQELIPFVEKNYRPQPHRTLVGHSLGGLFAINAMFEKPELFDAYIAISPTFWWDDEILRRKAKRYFRQNQPLEKFLYMSLGDEGRRMQTAAERFIEYFESEAPEELDWQFVSMSAETHGTTPHLTVYRGLLSLYRNWQLPEGALDSSLAFVESHYNKLSRRYGYEIQIPERTINIMGYRALGNEDFDLAVSLFKLNVEKYPHSANVYDSLGECYEAMGKPGLALQNYRQAVELGEENDDPNLPIYEDHLEKLKAQNDKDM